MAEKSILQKIQESQAWQTAGEFLSTRLGKFAVGAVTLSSIVGILTFNYLRNKDGQKGLGFSEIEATARLHERKLEKPVSPATAYYAKDNDYTMQMLEANNLARREGSSFHSFKYNYAYELEKKVEFTMRVHPLLTEYGREIPEHGKELLQRLSKQIDAARDAIPAAAAFDAAWDDYHHDSSHEECGPETCDSEGKNCTRSCWDVYDYTDNTYNYYADEGERANSLLKAFTAKYPDINIAAEDTIYETKETNADNEWAIRESRQDKYKNDYPTQQEYLYFANSHARNSNFNIYLPRAQANHREMTALTSAWSKARKTAHSLHVRTYDHSHAEPKEFIIAETVRKNAEELTANIDMIRKGIEYSIKNVPELTKKIQQFVNAKMHHGPGDAGKLYDEIIDMMEKNYEKNFAGAANIHSYTAGLTTLFTLLAVPAGGYGAIGIDNYIKTRRLRRREDGSYGYGDPLWRRMR